MKKKYLITGGAGFVGSHLIDYLVEDGEKLESIRVLVEPGQNLSNLDGRKVEVVVGDIRDKKIVKKAVDDVSVIYHLAAMTVDPGKTYEDYKTVNTNGTKNLLESIDIKKIKKFIFFSSISVFGLPAWSGDMINYDESYRKNYAEPYGKSKFYAEKEVIDSGIPYVIIRPTTVYGPKDKAGIYQLFKAVEINRFFIVGNGNNLMDYVYVKDLVRGARLAEKSRVVNEDFIIGAGKPTTQKQIINAVYSSVKRTQSNIHIPKWVLLPLSYPVEKIFMIVGMKPLLFPNRVKVLTANCYFNTDKAKKMIGYKPKVDLKKGMKITADWIRMHSTD